MEVNAPDILAALREQVECYQRLAKLAEAQHAHVQQGEMEPLLAVLQQRQAVLEQIVLLERTLSPAKRQWAQFAASLGEAPRRQAEQLLLETRELLERINAADRDDTLVLQQQRIDLGRQIGQAGAARVVTRSYAASAYAPRRPTMDVQR